VAGGRRDAPSPIWARFFSIGNLGADSLIFATRRAQIID